MGHKSEEVRLFEHYQKQALELYERNGINPKTGAPGKMTIAEDGRLMLSPTSEEFRKSPASYTQSADFGELTPLPERAGHVKAESLARRLWDACAKDPSMINVALSHLHEQLWKEGKAVTFEDLRRIAQELLQEALVKQRAQEKQYGIRA